MPRNENPFFDNHVYDRHRYALPANHPMAQNESLTQLQQAHLPAALWLLDSNRYRGQGRSVLMAHAAIELAMRGERVNLEDPSTVLTGPQGIQADRHFITVVMRRLDEEHRGHGFRLDSQYKTLTYHGRRPQ